jgi:hypothetical protein
MQRLSNVHAFIIYNVHLLWCRGIFVYRAVILLHMSNLLRITNVSFTHDTDCLVIDMYTVAIAEAFEDWCMLSNTE